MREKGRKIWVVINVALFSDSDLQLDSKKQWKRKIITNLKGKRNAATEHSWEMHWKRESEAKSASKLLSHSCSLPASLPPSP